MLRLWVSSADYQADIRISNEILKQLSEVYRKIRNTFRFMLGNLYDFDPNRDGISGQDLLEIDRWALMRLEQVGAKVTKAYDEYQFHVLFHTIHNFCTVDLSSIYFDILKDRLYASTPASTERRAAQTVLYELLQSLVVMVAPVLTFTSEEVWQHMRKRDGQPVSVQLAPWPSVKPERLDEALEPKWDALLVLRSEVTKALEITRRNKEIGNSLDADLTLYADEPSYNLLASVKSDLPNYFIVSAVEMKYGTDQAPPNAFKAENLPLSIVVKPAAKQKCERCWIHEELTHGSPEEPGLCARCAQVMSDAQ